MKEPQLSPLIERKNEVIDAGTVLRLADWSDDCRTQSVADMLEDALAAVHASREAGELPAVRAVLVLRYADGDVAETEVRAAGVDLERALGVLRLGQVWIESRGV